MPQNTQQASLAAKRSVHLKTSAYGFQTFAMLSEGAQHFENNHGKACFNPLSTRPSSSHSGKLHCQKVLQLQTSPTKAALPPRSWRVEWRQQKRATSLATMQKHPESQTSRNVQQNVIHKGSKVPLARVARRKSKFHRKNPNTKAVKGHESPCCSKPLGAHVEAWDFDK